MKWVSIFLTAIITMVIIFSVAKLPVGRTFMEKSDLEEMTAHFEEQVPRLMDYYQIPGVILGLIQEGELRWSKAFGYADVEQARPMALDAYCRMESISKSVTAWGVMKLAMKGQIDLDEPVVNYLQSWSFPASNYSTDEITTRQLLSHTAGLPLGEIGVRYEPTEAMPTLREVLTREAIPVREPGQAFSYSNTGFKLLELLVEEVSGLDFADYMKKEVLLPLGMQHSDFNWENTFASSIPNGYDEKGRAIPPYIYPDKAPGGLFARYEDIVLFVTAGMTDYNTHGLNVLDTGRIKELYSPVVKKPGVYGLAFDAYGLGHFLEWLSDGSKAVSHGGQGSGWMTHFHAIPASGDGIVLITNSQRSWPFFAFILKEWSSWLGFSSVGMGKIIWATLALWGVVALMLFVGLLSLWRLIKSWIGRQRHWAPWAMENRRGRFLKLAVFVLIFLAVVWCYSRPYLFLAAVFPIAFNWLLGVFLLIGSVLFIEAIMPLKKESGDS